MKDEYWQFILVKKAEAWGGSRPKQMRSTVSKSELQGFRKGLFCKRFCKGC